MMMESIVVLPEWKYWRMVSRVKWYPASAAVMLRSRHSHNEGVCDVFTQSEVISCKGYWHALAIIKFF
jgi:hypothetical protein